jgi:cell division GTPase FtsZ
VKILVIGLGQCGGRIADEFAHINARARRQRGLEIITGTYAVSTNATELAALAYVRADYRHRILIGAEQVMGQGVGGVNELGAQIALKHADQITEGIREAKEFFESDAICVVGGAAGGTGSGALPVICRQLKKRFAEIKTFALVVLPYAREEKLEGKAVYNTAVCLKSVASVADAVFLYDNEVYADADFPEDDFSVINRDIVAPFYNLLSAGAEKRKKHIGSKLLDAGDIFQTLEGWTVMGSGRNERSLMSSLFSGGPSREDSVMNRGIRAMDEAIGEVSRICELADATRALYLICAPARDINMDLIKGLADYLKNTVPNAVIRSGDYPIERSAIEVTVIVSRLSDVPRVRDIYTRSSAATRGKKDFTTRTDDIFIPDDPPEKDQPSLTDDIFIPDDFLETDED